MARVGIVMDTSDLPIERYSDWWTSVSDMGRNILEHQEAWLCWLGKLSCIAIGWITIILIIAILVAIGWIFGANQQLTKSQVATVTNTTSGYTVQFCDEERMPACGKCQNRGEYTLYWDDPASVRPYDVYPLMGVLREKIMIQLGDMVIVSWTPVSLTERVVWAEWNAEYTESYSYYLAWNYIVWLAWIGCYGFIILAGIVPLVITFLFVTLN